MRILVIDDYLNVELALRGILDGHVVSGVRDPLALPRMLAHEAPFDEASWICGTRSRLRPG
ncbi:MAG TPA: hypothetical protein VFW50_42630 [Streptosporangiaceae bacterium]|nr:hypothetical protein [Streptosporangiaceae bacterium]